MIKDLTQVVGQATEHKYFRPVAAFLLGALVIGSGYFGYSRYRVKVQEDAQKILAEVLDEYSAVISSNEPTELTNLEQMFDEGYLRSKKSTLAPVFLAYKSDVQARMGNLDEAQKTLQEALNQFGKNSPFYDFYDLKRILIDIDRTCEDACGENEPSGVAELKAFAYDTQRNYRSVALQQLADYYNVVGRFDDAQAALKELDQASSQQNIDLSGSF